jgi:hypothetical protein
MKEDGWSERKKERRNRCGREDNWIKSQIPKSYRGAILMKRAETKSGGGGLYASLIAWWTNILLIANI